MNQIPRFNDQGLLNVYIYYVLAEKKSIPHYSVSHILTLDKIDFSSLNIIDDAICNTNNEPYIIVHQLNRVDLSFMQYLVDSLE